tara:strand:- start:22 stop:258 length:237 start_codon:yes stop_codon:yes gene_type:complete
MTTVIVNKISTVITENTTINLRTRKALSEYLSNCTDDLEVRIYPELLDKVMALLVAADYTVTDYYMVNDEHMMIESFK